MDIDPSRISARVPGLIFKTFRFLKWRKARRQIVAVLMQEALQLAIYPHAHESAEAQHAARELWGILQRIAVPGESSPTSTAEKASSKVEDMVYGRFPRFGISGVGFKSRIANWVRKAAMTTEGQDLFEVLDADLVEHRDAKRLGFVVAELFVQRLEITRTYDRNLEAARLWLREEIRTHEASALAVEGRRAETERTHAIEISSALASGGTVSYVLDNIGVHSAVTLAAGYGTAILFALGSRYVVRRRPLLPRQVEYRLYVLEVICVFLESVFKFPVTRSVYSARDYLQQAMSFQAFEVSSWKRQIAWSVPESRGSPEKALAKPRLESSPALDDHATTADETHFSEALNELRLNAARLNDLASSVSDPLVQAAVMKLEKVAVTARKPEDLFVAMIQVLDALSR